MKKTIIAVTMLALACLAGCGTIRSSEPAKPKCYGFPGEVIVRPK